MNQLQKKIKLIRKLKIIESNGWCTQTFTQLFTPEGRRKKGKSKSVETKLTEEITEEVTLQCQKKRKGKKEVVKEAGKIQKEDVECEYDIPAFKGVSHENIKTPTHIVEVLKPIGILNVRKEKGWLAEVLLNYNNGINEWWFLHGAWALMEDETEAFLMHYNLDFEICGYKKDPRENRRHQYLRKFADEFTEEEISKDPEKDYDALTYNIHAKLADNVLEHYFVEEPPSDVDIEEEEEEEEDDGDNNNENKEQVEEQIKEKHEAETTDDNDEVPKITP